MAFSLFNKGRCTITDDLFLEITWEDGRGPEDDSELLAIIDVLDHSSGYSQRIQKISPT